MSDRDDDHPISGADHLRLTPDRARRAPGFKEWTYFCVSTHEVALLLTFTFLGRVDVRNAPTLPAARVVALAVKAGDTVIYSKYAGSEVKVDGKELKIVQESEILAIVD